MDTDKTAPSFRGGHDLGRQPLGCRPRFIFHSLFRTLLTLTLALAAACGPGQLQAQVGNAVDSDDDDAPPRLPILEPPPLDPQRPPPAQPPPATATAAMTNMLLRPVAPGIFEVGQVRLDTTTRTVSFPAVVNARQGPMEYLIVTPYGSTHESVLRTEVEPYHIHIAVLLLGAKGETNTVQNPPPTQQVADPWTQPIHGDPVHLEFAWEQNGTTRTCAAEDWVFNLATQSAMSRGSWTYNGSLVHRGLFRAQIDGAIASLIASPSALVNNSRKGADNDDIWTVNTNALPDIGTRVTALIHLD
ncbi:MAG: hypothetical protein IT581_07140 [Verrucomicrobiales bacterium]|nr:hypothetical protein [Verrucomicrobiales bacterium]